MKPNSFRTTNAGIAAILVVVLSSALQMFMGAKPEEVDIPEAEVDQVEASETPWVALGGVSLALIINAVGNIYARDNKVNSEGRVIQ